MDEIGDITDYIQGEAGLDATVIWGNCTDETLGEKVSVTVIATGFGGGNDRNFEFSKKPEKVVIALDADLPTSITKSLDDVKKPVEVTKDVNEPTLRTEITEQPTLNFEDSVEEVKRTIEDVVVEPVSIKEDVKKVIFNLEGDLQDDSTTAEVPYQERNPVNDIDENLLHSEGEEPTSELVVPDTTNLSETNNVDVVNETTEESFTEEKHIVWGASENEVKSKEEESTINEEPKQKITFVQKEETPQDIVEEGPVYTNKIPDEEQMKRSQERIMKIKELGLRMKTPSGINDLENEPAYKRRKINLDETAHSSENPISRFTLSSDEEGKPRLNDDNSFLHDNVD